MACGRYVGLRTWSLCSLECYGGFNHDLHCSCGRRRSHLTKDTRQYQAKNTDICTTNTDRTEILGGFRTWAKVASAGIIQASLFLDVRHLPCSFIAFSVHTLLDPSLKSSKRTKPLWHKMYNRSVEMMVRHMPKIGSRCRNTLSRTQLTRKGIKITYM